MTDEWEKSFLPLDDPRAIKPPEQCTNDLERFGYAQCAFCGDLLHQDEASVLIHYDEAKQHTAFFCGEHCKSEHYLWRIRKGGV